MDFNVKRNDSLKKEEDNFPKDSVHIAYKFSALIKKEFKDFIKSVVLFGSTARKNKNADDIDILLILDDVNIEFNKAIVQGYRIITQHIIQEVSDKLHITSMRLTNFWDYLRKGDPVAINILREGVAIIDSGIFNPAKILLYQGRIKPSNESVSNYIQRSEFSLINSKRHVLVACIDLYWAVMDAAESALMSINQIPPSPAHVHNLIDEKFTNTGKLEKKYSIILQEFYHLNKAINHNEITYIPGSQYATYLKEAESFVKEMQKIVKENIDKKL